MPSLDEQILSWNPWWADRSLIDHDSQRVPIEVKGDSDSGIGRSRLAIANAFGEGVVASRTVFDPDGDVPVIPVPVLLAGLAETPKRDSPVG